MDIHEIASGLTLDPAGYWLAPETTQPSYPAEGNDICFGMEEESFWLAHRNCAITVIYTPLVFALCVVLPSLIESMTDHRGVAVAAVFFLTIWVSMVQLRDYALQYPPPPPVEAVPAK
ncbi:MAG: hypothetical protein JJE51_14985 [Thermoanaerobaculia bacterium]|nr:hypothetical protein [Thermoanaerobaculia bacterium]